MENNLISQEVVDILQFRIQQEEQSARLYEQMSLYLNNEGYINSSKYWKKYAEDEMSHAGWSKEYLLSFGIMPQLPDLDSPSGEFNGLPDVFRKTYDHEVLVSNQCKELGKKAMESGDFILFTLAQKYNSEQLEEMGNVTTMLDLLKTFGEEKHTLLLLDSHIEHYLA